MRALLGWTAAAAALFMLQASPALAQAQAYENSVSLRIGGYFPTNLPVTQGTIYGLEFRTLLGARDGVAYGICYFNEERTEIEDLGAAGGPVTLHADIELIPVLMSWYHIWPRQRTTWYAGAGAGIYSAKAFSGGYNSTSQFKDVGDFRFLEDATLVGAHFYGGVEFLPDSRWGWNAEARLHWVSDGWSAFETSVGGLFRF